MILTCPGCAARFVVADSRIDPEMREVSHANCGTVWVLGEEPHLPAVEPEPAVVREEAPLDQAFEPSEPSPAPAIVCEESDPAEPLVYTPALRMAAPEPAHKFPEFDCDRLREQLTWATTLPKQRVGAFAVGASLTVAMSAELMLLFHEEIGHAWPTMAHLYTTFGL